MVSLGWINLHSTTKCTGLGRVLATFVSQGPRTLGNPAMIVVPPAPSIILLETQDPDSPHAGGPDNQKTDRHLNNILSHYIDPSQKAPCQDPSLHAAPPAPSAGLRCAHAAALQVVSPRPSTWSQLAPETTHAHVVWDNAGTVLPRRG